jgi:ribosomal protein S17
MNSGKSYNSVQQFQSHETQYHSAHQEEEFDNEKGDKVKVDTGRRIKEKKEMKTLR